MMGNKIENHDEIVGSEEVKLSEGNVVARTHVAEKEGPQQPPTSTARMLRPWQCDIPLPRAMQISQREATDPEIVAVKW